MSTQVVDAEIIEPLNADVLSDDNCIPAMDAEVVQAHRSWPFRCYDFLVLLVSRGFGVASMIVILAVLAAIPVVQFLTHGYLLEVAGRVGRTGQLRSAFFGLAKASKIGQIILGTLICMLPAYFNSLSWHNAELISPGSDIANSRRIILWIVTLLSVTHVAAAWFCGGQLKHFFWPVIAPVSLVLWAIRRVLGLPGCRTFIGRITNPVAPNLVGDLANTKPLKDWFLPVVVFKAVVEGRLLNDAREQLWKFFIDLRLHHYFWMGVRGLIGTMIWLLIPSAVFLMATMIFRSDINDGVAILFILPGMLLAGLVFTFLFAVQANFARTNRFQAFFDLGTAFRVLRSSPIMFFVAITLSFVLVLPLFLLMIEPIDPQLAWAPCLVYVALLWPGKVLAGKAISRGVGRTQAAHFMISYPLICAMVAIAASYSLLLYFTQFVAASGPFSFIQNPVFTIPAPYWI